jgi:hypothetical protein
VRFSEDIVALAAYLEHDPVRIYNWVRNGIEYIPTHGSIQGADLTLRNRRGNAYDTASLLIALLRVSGIRARYAFGLVEIPIERVMRWVGGAAEPAVALDVLSAGGIPVTGLASGGRIAAARLEHVWVEAWIDFVPSRGAKHRQGDTWVPMGPSFKEWHTEDGPDLEREPPYAVAPLLAGLTDHLETAPDPAWIRALDLQPLRDAYADAERNLDAWMEGLEAQDRWMGRTRSLEEHYFSLLSDGLPYPVAVRAAVSARLSEAVQTSFGFALYAGEGEQRADAPLLDYRAHLPALADKRITFGFVAATEDDQALLDRYLLGEPDPDPDADPDALLDPARVATSIPGYLIHLRAVLWVDGQVVAEGGVFPMGRELYSTTRITRLTGGEHRADNRHIAGDFLAIGLDLQGIPLERLYVHEEKGVRGRDLYHHALTSLFVQQDLLLEHLVEFGGMIAYRQPSFGFMGSRLRTTYLFGIPREVHTDAAGFDIDFSIQTLSALTNDPPLRRRTNELIGLHLSSLEHEILEYAIAPETETLGQAASTASVMVAALEQGMRIYGLHAGSAAAALPEITVSEAVRQDILDAVGKGYRVQIPEGPVTIGTWTGIGYIVIDPRTGNGAYRIAGGSSGGEIRDAQVAALNAANWLIGKAAAHPLLVKFVHKVTTKNPLGRLVATAANVMRSMSLIMLRVAPADLTTGCTAGSNTASTAGASGPASQREECTDEEEVLLELLAGGAVIRCLRKGFTLAAIDCASFRMAPQLRETGQVFLVAMRSVLRRSG